MTHFFRMKTKKRMKKVRMHIHQVKMKLVRFAQFYEPVNLQLISKDLKRIKLFQKVLMKTMKKKSHRRQRLNLVSYIKLFKDKKLKLVVTKLSVFRIRSKCGFR